MYTVQSAVCILTTPSIVTYPSDSVPSVTVKADGTGFQVDSRDPDNATLPGTIPSPITATGAAPDGNCRRRGIGAATKQPPCLWLSHAWQHRQLRELE